MAGKMRLTHAGQFQNEFNLTDGATAAGNRVERGNFVYWDGTSLKKASNWTWATSDAASRRAITPQFAGVIDVENPVTNTISKTHALYTTGLAKFTISSSTYNQWQMVGIAGNGSSTLHNDTVAIVTDPREAIGFIWKDYASATTEVEVMYFSSYGENGTMASRIKMFSFYIGATAFTTAGDVLASWTFLTRTKVIAARFLADVATATATNVFTFKNGSDAFDQTFSVPSGTNPGVWVEQLFTAAGANPSREYFDSTTALNITSDGAGTGAPGTMFVYYMELPKVL